MDSLRATLRGCLQVFCILVVLCRGSIGSFLKKDMFQGRELMDIEEERVADSNASLGDFTLRQVFQNTTQDDTPFDMICCCPIGAGQYRAYKYEYPPPSAGCCCNTTDVCTLCSESNAFGSVCGSGQVCGILLLMSALIGTLAVTICVTGVFMARRRRQRRVTLDQFVSGHVPASQANRPSVQMIEIPNDQLKEIHIKQVPENEENGEAKECPICLDTVPVHTGIWSEFPCGHGSCTLCVNDLLRHSSRRVNSNTVAVLCPLCRTLAVAEMSSENEPHIEVRDVEADTVASDAHEARDGVDHHVVIDSDSNAMPSARGHDDDEHNTTNNNNNTNSDDDDALHRVETGQHR
mmetsp:Transcript_8107/g.16267  ORF Transcript_8107/g.16267 Transcript_8107/m.16267 type:complete len:350 (+) Transcript_8107:84-1133(+)